MVRKLLTAAAVIAVLGVAVLAGTASCLLHTPTPAPEARQAPPLVPSLAGAAAKRSRVADATRLLE